MDRRPRPGPHRPPPRVLPPPLPGRQGARSPTLPPAAKHTGSCSPHTQRIPFPPPASPFPAAPRRLPPPLPPRPAGGTPSCAAPNRCSRLPPPPQSRSAFRLPSASSARRPSGLVVPPRYSRRPLRCFRAVAPAGRDGALRHGGGVRAGWGTPGQAGPGAEREEGAGGAAGRRGGREGGRAVGGSCPAWGKVRGRGGEGGGGTGRQQQRGRLHPQVSGGGSLRWGGGEAGTGRPGPPAAAPRLAFSRPEAPAGPRLPPGPPRTTCCRWARARLARGEGGSRARRPRWRGVGGGHPVWGRRCWGEAGMR